MYSENGRLKTKETANINSKKSRMVCNKCGHIEEDRSSIFGEENYCNNCLSKDVRFEYK